MKIRHITLEDLQNPDLFYPEDIGKLMTDDILFSKYGYIIDYPRKDKNNKTDDKSIYKQKKEIGEEKQMNHEDDDNIDREEKKKKVSKLKKFIFGIILLLFLILGFFTSIYHVTEQEQAVVTRFGKVIDIKSAGLYFRIPYFIDDIHKVHTTTYGLPIGYVIDPDSQQEGQSGEAVSTNDSVMITSDFNLLDVDFYLEYKVGDPIKYLYNSSDPVSILKNLTISAIRTVISDYTVDAVMTTDKSKIQSDIKTLLQDSLERTDIGLQVVNISMQDAEPPTADIMAAFKSVETAKQNAETAITNANQYNSEQIPNAEAEADKIVQDAEAIKAQRIAEADNEVETFNKTYNEYKKYPLITKKRMFYETMEEMLPDLKVIITDGQTDTMLPLDLFSYNNITTTPAATEAQQ